MLCSYTQYSSQTTIVADYICSYQCEKVWNLLIYDSLFFNYKTQNDSVHLQKIIKVFDIKWVGSFSGEFKKSQMCEKNVDASKQFAANHLKFIC